VIAAHDTTPRLLHGEPPPAVLLQTAIEPTVAIGTLVVAALAFGQAFEGHYLILALIVFSLTFPGRAPRAGSNGSMAGDILANWAVIVILLLLLGWATRTLDAFDERAILAWMVAAPVTLFAAHRALPLVLPWVLAAEGMQRVAVIACGNDVGRRLAAQIRATPFLAIRIAGYFDDRAPERMAEVGAGEIIGPVRALAEHVKNHRVDLIYITLPMTSQPRILKLLDDLRDTTASIYVAPDIFHFDLIQARVDAIGGIPVVAVCETPFRGVTGLVKRASDIVLAAAILLLIAPLMLAIAIGIKLTSPGPVIFRQRRYGQDGREIIVYKFRTMTVLEDGGTVRQATRNDQRVTRFGAWLRRASFDELPQFVNVLQGHMSVVGPRPHAVAHNEMYRKLIKSYMIRHKVKPGITGWAQVNGLRGETDTLEKMRARIEYDLAYLRNWSLGLDLYIVWKTIFVVLQKDNAY
jgi:Undecaprenyl-phosphate glucose phosphotransferase